MTGMKQPEDLTLDEVREHTALYQRLYYKLRMQDPDYATATRERKGLSKQRMKEARGEKIKAFLTKSRVWIIWLLLSRIKLRNKTVVIVMTITTSVDERSDLFRQLMCA